MYRRAVVLLVSVAGLYISASVFALATCQMAVRPYLTVALTSANAIVMCGLLVWSAYRIHRARSFGLAIGVCTYLLVQSVLAVVLALVLTYKAGRVLQVLHLAYVVTVVICLVTVLLAWYIHRQKLV